VYPYEPEYVEAFDRDSVMVSRDMGAIPVCIPEKEQIRGIHPMNSFSAIGPLAEELIAKQTYLNVYGSLKMMYEIGESYVALIEVDLTSATAIHYAEERELVGIFSPTGAKIGGTHQEIAVGSCWDGFNVFDTHVEEMERAHKVGESQWHFFRFGNLLM